MCWCSSGAINKVIGGDARGPGHTAYDALEVEMDDNIPQFNDSHDHEEVLAAFDKAIATEEMT